MTKRAESKYKIDRRMGQNIWGRPKSPVNRREYGPGQHGQRRKGKLSDYGTQLKAKQKLKGYYGNITEKQFRSGEAPSTMLASSWSCGTRFRPARVISVMSGVHCHTSTRTRPIIAVLALARMDFGPRMPRLWKSQ